MNKSNFDLSITINSKTITEYEHDGSTFVEGRKGSNFVIRFRNNSNNKVLAIPSVDGLNTLNGQQASSDSPGFVVDPYSTIDIKGWTIDNSSIAQFIFNDKNTSYAREVNGGSNVGVIGMLVFAEEVIQPFIPVVPHVRRYDPTKTSPWVSPFIPTYPSNPFDPVWISSSSISYGSTALVQEEPFTLGTGWGSKKTEHLNEVTFNKGNLLETLVIYYDSRKNLERRGIQISKVPQTYSTKLPEAFSGIGCKPPTGWKG